MIQRRSFLLGIVGALVAPAIVRAESLMKIVPIVDPAAMRAAQMMEIWRSMDVEWIGYMAGQAPAGEGHLVRFMEASNEAWSMVNGVWMMTSYTHERIEL